MKMLILRALVKKALHAKVQIASMRVVEIIYIVCMFPCYLVCLSSVVLLHVI